MKFPNMKRPVLALALGLSVGVSRLPAQAQGRVYGDIYVPDSSVERPRDIGSRFHTNHLIMVQPRGGLGPSGGMTPAQIRSFYSIPSTGGHDVIAIVGAYDYPNALADFNTFATKFGLPTETSKTVTATTNKVFQVIYQNGKKPTGNVGWAQESALDIEWAHAMAPKAKIVLLEAQSSGLADLLATVDLAVKQTGVKQVSMSWGSSEFSSEASYDFHFNINGPVFFSSSGDVGGITSFPSTSSYVVAVGGTSVATNSTGAFLSETGWSGSGGGVSAYETRPSWQSGIANTGAKRSVPDISSDANPSTGVQVYGPGSNGVSGWLVFGGTSVSSPCIAGMVNVGGATYTNTTQLLTKIYSKLGATSLRDITVGNSGFSCLTGWDFVTGVGAPVGTTGF